MTLDNLDFLPLKVIRVSASGRRIYDPEDKGKLIAACRQSAAPVSTMARKAGIKPKQLHNWLAPGRAPRVQTLTSTAFVPVVEIGAGAAANQTPQTPAPVRLFAQLCNGVKIELHCAANDSVVVTTMINALGAS